MLIPDIHLLETLCSIPAPSGDERRMKEFILNYVDVNSPKWARQPEVIHGPEIQDCILLKFGNPRLAALAHMDSTGFTVRYQNQLIPVGSPDPHDGDQLVGTDVHGPIECSLYFEEGHAFYSFGRGIERGTTLTYKPRFSFNGKHIESPYLDNRAGVLNLLKISETLKDGLLVFSTWEEHGGGSVPFLAKLFYENFGISQCLISDVTWCSDGIFSENGVVVSVRDSNIPRRSFIDAILSLTKAADVPYQIEVEAHGSSDGREIQHAPYPIDWCFIGPPCDDPHSSQERIAWADLKSMMGIYQILFDEL